MCILNVLWKEAGARVERSLRIANRDCSAHCSDDWEERQFRFVLITFGAGADRGHDDHDSKFRAPEMPEACKTAIPALCLQDVRASLEVVMWSIRFQRLYCWKNDQQSQEGEREHEERHS